MSEAERAATSAGAGDDNDELRIGLVLNGGVSLAIWMGGVVLEIDRLRRGVGGYSELLALTRSDVRVDVISGASAGGLNGALLALAMARGGEVTNVRDVWMQQGAIEDLLRDPRDKQPPSLLRGDEFFLTGIATALQRVADEASKNPDEAKGVSPIRLSITTTTMEGEPKGYDDYFGEPIPDIDHRGLLSFQRGKSDEPSVDEHGQDVTRDDFAPDMDGRVDRAIRRLALAGRSTASFPGAFEPSFCPVDPPGSWKLDDHHPDLGPRASFSTSRWAIDGGVLVNTPFRPALDAIKTLPADRAVRRVLAYVVPNPGRVDHVPVADPTKPPTLGGVVRDALSTLPRVQSIGRELQEISENNRRVLRRNYTREALLSALDADGLLSAADALLQTYIQVRREGAADDIRSALLRRPSTRLKQAEALATVEVMQGDVPFLPPASMLGSWKETTLDPWRWGLAPIEHAANTALDLIGRSMREPLFKDSRPALGEQRKALHAVLAELRTLQRETDDAWIARVAATLESPKKKAADPTLDATPDPRIGALAERLASIFVAVRRALPAAAKEGSKEAAIVLGMLDTLAPAGGDEADGARCLRQLLALDIVQRAAGPDLGGIDQQIRLVMCSADAGNSFDGRNTPQGKLAGLQVNHFGSFYKASWRANDWLWGRLDGADRLARLVVDPSRLQQLVQEGLGVDELARAVEKLATCRGTERCDYLAGEHEKEKGKVASELAGLAGPAPIAPGDLSTTYKAVRRRLQLEILLAELPLLAAAARQDVETNRTAPGAFGAHWVVEHDLGKSPSPKVAVDAFTACRIGEEAIAGEFGSDQFTRVSTKAAAVFSSVAPQLAPGWRPIRVLARGVRGTALALYYLGMGVLTDSRTSRFLVALVLGLGGALLALAVFGTGTPAVFTAIGALLVVAAVILATLRSAFWSAVVVVVLMVATIAGAYALRHHHPHVPVWLNRLAPAIAVVVVALLAIVLGSLPLRRSPPSLPAAGTHPPGYEAELARLGARAKRERVSPTEARNELRRILRLVDGASPPAGEEALPDRE